MFHNDFHRSCISGILGLGPYCFHSKLTHWGRATHICVSKLTIITSDNGLSPGRRQAIIWNNAGILSIGLIGTKFSEILIEVLTFSFKKMRLKVSSAKWRPFCLGLNVLRCSDNQAANGTSWQVWLQQDHMINYYSDIEEITTMISRVML